MQVQALPGASLHDGRERVEREDRGELCLSASGTVVLVSSNAILRVARRSVKLPASRTIPLRCRALLLPSSKRDVEKGTERGFERV